ncbi:GlcG/HbpS family heme-binding protein [Rhodobacter lacus]|uniref:Heme-binding protein n=1 Tax=Rhodobacter lacus TaxID=1641972 RepID=A0ABW5A8B0_9RHOB
MALLDTILATELAARRPLVLIDACRIAARAELEARRLGVPVCVALCDAAGDALLFHRMEGALPASVTLAPAKARTAARYRMGTEDLGALCAPGGMLEGLGAAESGLVLFGGGLPIRAGAAVLGAIGISGGTVAEDMQIARAAIAGHWGAALEKGQGR